MRWNVKKSSLHSGHLTHNLSTGMCLKPYRCHFTHRFAKFGTIALQKVFLIQCWEQRLLGAWTQRKAQDAHRTTVRVLVSKSRFHPADKGASRPDPCCTASAPRGWRQQERDRALPESQDGCEHP